MREILGEVDRIEKTGSGSISSEKAASAKSYYFRWKKKAAFFPTPAVFTIFFAVLLFFSSCVPALAALAFLAGVKAMNEIYGTKKQYVREMIGDLRHYKPKDRDYFVTGIVADLWSAGEAGKYTYESRLGLLLILAALAAAPCVLAILFYASPIFAWIAKSIMLIFAVIVAVANFKNEPKG